jgi:hypothetical protein
VILGVERWREDMRRSLGAQRKRREGRFGHTAAKD